MIKNNKGSFDLQTYLIGIVLVIGILVTFGTVYSNMAKSYSIDTTQADSFSNTYNKLEEVSTITGEMEADSTAANLGTEAQATTFYGSTLSLIKKIGSIISIPKEMIISMVNSLSIPPI